MLMGSNKIKFYNQYNYVSVQTEIGINFDKNIRIFQTFETLKSVILMGSIKITIVQLFTMIKLL